jgi:RNA-directed DNA polymerase
MHKKVQRKIEILVRSLNFRKYAVWKVAKNSGSITPGIDKFIFQSKKEQSHMVERLLILLKKYKASPVRRVFIPKTGNKLRPLGIPTF